MYIIAIGEGEVVAMDIGTLPWTDDECLEYTQVLSIDGRYFYTSC